MRFVPAAADSSAAQRMLDEYFSSRELGFSGGRYLVVPPDASRFVPPAGIFLLVQDDAGEAVGCGGVRRLEDAEEGPVFEVKHLWLRPETRGRGWGRALLAELEREAVRLGAATLVLDTNATLTAAGGLYRSSGFTDIPPYNDNPNATNWYRKALA
ncbi:MAG: acetyltransferase, N-acetylglutamate synthase [Naasia sp.]|jgi:ribosomal protein S18 acetylase RimI-like enzyme|uniref:GNAT family N-acetyltransferase n=1 Tax=Naasia sp. TaxID=2546198 RepID=UPI002610FBB5|nr:GNAT family N-acetyltransferase [Naasia sp.]MCU1571300.1 acetyltransferase, N-acetylglutamate synthase [Naasia sp.]